MYCLKNGHVSFRVGKDNGYLKNQPMLCLEYGGNCTEKHCRSLFKGEK